VTFPRLQDPFRRILWFTAIAAAVGAVYSQYYAVVHGLPLFRSYNMARGVMTGALIASIVASIDGLVLSGPLGAPIRRAPFTAHVLVKTLIYLAVILCALKLAAWTFPAPNDPGIERGEVVFSLAAAFVFNFVSDVNHLLGQNALMNFITGRYYAPKVESRVFLFIDMEGSTGWAERLGPLGFHRLVNCFVDDLTQPIVAARGEIHRYVGDEVIATWKLQDGIASGRCVAACFGALDRLAGRAPDYQREFGAAIRARVGLHCGPVVTGEMGSVRKEIVFLGDTVNTTARIQDLCRETGDRAIASADLIDRLELPHGIAKRSLGDLKLRGKGAELALYALTKTAPRAGRPQARGRKTAPAETPISLSLLGFGQGLGDN
jgi:adenylate cyclase